MGSFFNPLFPSGTGLRLPPAADFFVGLNFGLKELGLGFGLGTISGTFFGLTFGLRDVDLGLSLGISLGIGD